MKITTMPAIAFSLLCLIAGQARADQWDNDLYHRQQDIAWKTYVEQEQKIGDEIQALSSEKCKSDKIRLIKNDLLAYPGTMDDFYNTYRVSGVMYQSSEASQMHASILSSTAQFKLKFADQMLKKGCLDEADNQYREVIDIYIGNSYQAYRERAKIGIDDVRAKRRGK